MTQHQSSFVVLTIRRTEAEELQRAAVEHIRGKHMKTKTRRSEIDMGEDVFVYLERFIHAYAASRLKIPGKNEDIMANARCGLLSRVSEKDVFELLEEATKTVDGMVRAKGLRKAPATIAL
jgi:hypothetical protein